MTQPAASYPLLFKVGELVMGDGFLARVEGRGRVLLTQDADDNEWWVYGVEPGAIAQGGATPQEANLRFNKGLREILYDLSKRAGTFNRFKADVESFFCAIDEVEASRWDGALESLRDGGSVDDPFVAALRRVDVSKARCHVTVELIRADRAKGLKAAMNATAAIAVANPEAA